MLNAVSIILFLFFLQAFAASAQNITTIRNPRTFSLNYSSLSIKAMAFSCLAVPELIDDLNCQPAFLPLEKKSKFSANGSISNGYQSLTKGRRILSNDLDSEFINSLFNENRIIEVEMNPSMFFSSSHLSGKYLLAGFQFYSTQRNQADPVLNVFAAESKHWTLQMGNDYQKWFFYGAQLRVTQDKVVQKSFRLIDLGTDSGKDYLKPTSNSRIFVEPGLGFVFGAWKLSLLGANLRAVDDSEVELPENSELQAGAAYSTDLLSGTLDLSMDYKSLSYQETEDQKFHFGTRFRYGVLNMLGGADYYGVSGGIAFALEKIYSGIMYSSSQVPWRKSDDYAQTVYIEIGWQL